MRRSRKSARAWTSAIAELVRERILVDGPTYDHLARSLANRLNPFELAVLRGVNDGGVKAAPDGPPPPVMKPAATKDARVLRTHAPTGDLRSLADWLETRQSTRTYSKQPLARRQFEQFLETTARAYAHVDTPGLGTTSLRNYPSGGARYPLEIYPVIFNVRSFAPGFYHYHPFHHRLQFVGRHPAYLEALRRVVRLKMGRPATDPTEPSVLFIVTAVFARTCWKYEGIPFQLVLQETGSLYQTMYLTATVMGLAACAVGAFPERAIGEILALGDDEAQVGLFVLGTRIKRRNARSPLIVERVRFRPGSPFSADPSRSSVELIFRGGETETIDERDFKVLRSGGRLLCAVKRGRQRAVFTGQARLTVMRRLRLRRR